MRMLKPPTAPTFTAFTLRRGFIHLNGQGRLRGALCRRGHNSASGPPSKEQTDGPEEVSDTEWEIRSGRAIALLRETLPDFFKVGLVENSTEDESAGSIYSPRIQLLYTPPARLPPFPPTLHIEGLPLYHASSMFVRHTLNMFYTDLSVELRRMHDVKGARRDRKFTIGTAVLGKSRMGSTRVEWDVTSTYHISPLTGLIYRHVVESIHPAPHSSIYDTLASTITRLSGLKPDPTPSVPSTCGAMAEPEKRNRR
ncbi:hypothetical protein FRC19_009616 [Serendipita sp. 401]|nr:hypothetical protein FRC19_009616 [Serendipita sp. 401]KAG9052519.1 hypothetical protein FS842_009732 [Serendipita sp. 407]